MGTRLVKKLVVNVETEGLVYIEGCVTCQVIVALLSAGD